MANKWLCPAEPHDCEYDGAVNFMRKLFGENYIDGLLGVASSGAGGEPITATIISFISYIILFILLVILVVVVVMKILNMGKTGDWSDENVGYWGYLRPVIAVVCLLPMGAYPIIVNLVVLIALFGNGLANTLYNKIPEHFVNGASLTKIFSDEKDANGNDITTPEELALKQSNTMQKYALYGSLHGACIGKLKNMGYAVVPVVSMDNEQGRISVTYYNRESANDSSIWNPFTWFNSGPTDSGQEFGVSSEGVCGRVEFDFFVSSEFTDKYGEFAAGTNNSFFNQYGGASGARADQSVRTKSIQNSINELVATSAKVGAKVNNLRTSYALRTYLSGLVHTGGMYGAKQCVGIAEQMTENVAKAFEVSESRQVSLVEITPYFSASSLVNGSGRYVSGVTSISNSNQQRAGVQLIASGASICTASKRATGQPWPTNQMDAAAVNGTGDAAAAAAASGQLKFFDAKSIFDMAELMEQNLFERQRELYLGFNGNQALPTKLKQTEERIKRDFNRYLVGRGWIYMPEASVILRNLEHSLKGMFYSASGNAVIFSKAISTEESGNIDDYNHFLKEVGNYNSKAFATFANSGNRINPSLGAELRIGNIGATDNTMGNVLDGVVDVGFVRGIQASLINMLSGDKLTDDPIGGLVEFGNSAILLGTAVDAMQNGVASSSLAAAAMGGLTNTGNPQAVVTSGVLGATASIAATVLDTITGMVTPTLQELEDALDGVGHFLGVIVPSYPALMLVVAAVAWAMQVVVTAIGIMLWLILAAIPGNTFVGNVQQLWVTLLALLFRPILILSGFMLAFLMASAVILYLFESWFVTKGLLSMEADSALTQLVIEVKLFKSDMWRLAIMIAIVYYFVFSWIQELSDELFNFLGTNLLPIFGDVSSQAIASKFGAIMGGAKTSARNAARSKMQAKKERLKELQENPPKPPKEDPRGSGGPKPPTPTPPSGPGGSSASNVSRGTSRIAGSTTNTNAAPVAASKQPNLKTAVFTKATGSGSGTGTAAAKAVGSGVFVSAGSAAAKAGGATVGTAAKAAAGDTALASKANTAEQNAPQAKSRSNFMNKVVSGAEKTTNFMLGAAVGRSNEVLKGTFKPLDNIRSVARGVVGRRPKK